MRQIGIVAGGPEQCLPRLNEWEDQIDTWIGADRGAYILAEHHIHMREAVGDFDSVTKEEKNLLEQFSDRIVQHPIEKDETDLEIAIAKALAYHPNYIYLFGVTGGRMDHALINLQLLEKLLVKKVHGIIVDRQNQIELYASGHYHLKNDAHYQHYSFIPYTEKVIQLTLKNFYYPLRDHNLPKGSTRCISNKIVGHEGEFSFVDGLLYVIKSKG